MGATAKTPVEQETNCIVRSVAAALKSDHSLEAVTLDRSQKTIAVATLGKADEAQIERRIDESIHLAEAGASEIGCNLLTANPDCSQCGLPLTAAERQAITVTHQGAMTTIARVTCPTAPKFWRWRNLPWPRIV